MNTPQIEKTSNSQWDQVKKEIIQLWSSVNADELDRTRGNVKEIANLIHNKYGSAKKAVLQRLTEVFQKYEMASAHA
jgi:uncharacterized protein YjbJ (UPF0337 family)